jgi:phosphoribosyl 1,2-cyclic phosphodiesterase
MDIKFLGVGAAYYPIWGSNSAFFTLKDQLYLLDCGETTFQHISARPELTDCEKITVLVTHLHADHIGSLSTFAAYCLQVLGKEVCIASPDPTLPNILSMMGVEPDIYQFQQDFSAPFPGGLTVVPVRVEHASEMACYGYFLSDGCSAVFYSGDANTLPQIALDRLRMGEISHIYQETTYETGTHSYHCSLEQLCELVPVDLRRQITCMHFGADFRAAAEAAGFRTARAEGMPFSRTDINADIRQ